MLKLKTKGAIFTVDDFGINRQANELIFRAFSEGVLTHASVMVNMPGSNEALRATKNFRKIKFGLHLNLSDSIGWVRFLTAASLGFVPTEKIEQEVRKQIELMQKFVRPIPFINSHHNVHFWPAVLPIVIKLAKEYKIKKIRLPQRLIGPGLKPMAIRLTKPARHLQQIDRHTNSWLDLDWHHRRYWKKLIENLPSDSEISCHPQASLQWLIKNKTKLN